MNPRRLHALFDARFRPLKKVADGVAVQSTGGKTTRYVDFDNPQTGGKSLAEYFERG